MSDPVEVLGVDGSFKKTTRKCAQVRLALRNKQAVVVRKKPHFVIRVTATGETLSW